MTTRTASHMDKPSRPVLFTARSTKPHAVPVAQMVSPERAAISQEDVADAALLARLLEMPFPAFTQTVAALLGRLGYVEVAAMKPMHGQGKGRNQHGGYDLRMYLPTRLTRGLVIAQVKQYREAVPRAFVDELRGTMLRLGASQGLLVTTSAFSASAIEAAQAAQYAAPVRLMDGQELARLLREHPDVLAGVPLPDNKQQTGSDQQQAASARNRSREVNGFKLRPTGPERSERLHLAFLDGLGDPPNKRTPAHVADPAKDNGTLALHIEVRLVPAGTDNEETAKRNGAKAGGRP